MTPLSQKKLFLLDMDGTIYLSGTLFDGAAEFLSRVRGQGGRYVFLTNNSSRGTDAYIDKLARMGIASDADDFLTSTDAVIRHIKKEMPSETFYVCGTQSLKNQLVKSGVSISNEPCGSSTALLLAYDTELTYKKLEDCCILLNRGVRYIATHPDMVCPTWYGSAPDCGSLIELLYTATGRRPDYIAGKPRPDMAFLAMSKFGCSASETCLVGDRVYTDIACGANAGIDTVFVLSGEGVRSDIEKYGVEPTHIFESIRDVLHSIEQGA